MRSGRATDSTLTTSAPSEGEHVGRRRARPPRGAVDHPDPVERQPGLASGSPGPGGPVDLPGVLALGGAGPNGGGSRPRGGRAYAAAQEPPGGVEA